MDTSASSRGLWRAGPPAESAALMTVAAAFPGLPDAYIAFVRRENGSEGDLGVSPGWIALWPVEELAARNAGYNIAEALKGFIGFATDGGGELIAFDTRRAPWRVCTVPFVPLDESCALQIATDFTALSEQFGSISTAG